MKNWLLAVMSPLLFSGCASLGPVITISANFPISSPSITFRNSAGPGVTTTPQLYGNWLVHRTGKNKGKEVELGHGQSYTLILPRNLSNQTIYIPVAVLVKKNKMVVGSYSRCVAIYAQGNSTEELNFGPHHLRDLKQGYTGRPCGGWY